MGNATGIEWTDATWNPTRGCRRTAPAGSKQSGCGDPTGGGCYAERTAARFCGPGQPYEGLITLTANGPRWSGKTRFVAEHLADPLRWKKPLRIFVDSMSDLFYDDFTNEQIAAVFGVMAAAPQHTFQVLTKRARRMREWFEWVKERGASVIMREATAHLFNGIDITNRRLYEWWRDHDHRIAWPLPNVWLGVSVENQAAADERIPELLRTPAAMRFLSCEPLLGDLNLALWLGSTAADGGHVPGIDWVITGCESGPGARGAESAWYRSLRDQCEEAGVPFFLKQATEEGTWSGDNEHEQTVLCGPGSHRKPGGIIGAPYLDGVQHLAIPEVPRG